MATVESSTLTGLMTAEEFAVMPDQGHPVELVRGRIVAMNAPGFSHGKYCARICFFLMLYLRDHDIGHVLSNDSGVVTQRGPDTVRGGDVSFYRYDRLSKNERPTKYPAVAPNLVFEVRSPSDRWKDILAKTAEYLQAGVDTVCVVDPDTETIRVYLPDQPETTLEIDDTLVLPELLPKFSLTVKELFE